MYSCTDGGKESYQDITLEALSGLKSSKYELSSEAIRGQIKQLVKSETSSSAAIKYVCDYYKADKPLVWIDRHGIDSRVDTLLAFISKVQSRQTACLDRPSRHRLACRHLARVHFQG